MDQERQRIEEDLRGVVSGDVICDDVGRSLYATDGSLFEVQPLVDRAVTHALHLGLAPAQLLAMVRESLKEHRSCMIRPS